MQSVRITIDPLVVLISAAIVSGADQGIVAVLVRRLEVVLLTLSLLEVFVRCLRLRLAFQKGW
jgi:hypothetical protein